MGKGRKMIALVILSIMAGMVYLTPFLRFTFYDQMIEALQITDVQIGTLGGIYGVFALIGYLPGGFLAEKFSAKHLLILSAAGMFAATVWVCFYPGFWALCVIHAMFGTFSVITFWSAYLKAVRNLGREDEQARLCGSSEAIRGIGQAVVSFISLGAVNAFGQAAVGFRIMLIINAVVFFALIVAIIIFIPKDDISAEGQKVSEKKDNLFETAGRLLKSPSVWICIFVIMSGFTVWTTVNGYMGTYGTRVLNLPDGLSSTLSIVRSYVVVLFAGLIGGVVIDKFSCKGKGLFVIFLLEVLSVAGIFLTSNLIFVCVAVTLILGFFANIIKSTYWSILGEAGISRQLTGLATGIISVIGFTPDAFSAPVVSRFIRYGEQQGNVETGFNIMLVWLAVWAVLGMTGSLILKRYTEKNGLSVKANG